MVSLGNDNRHQGAHFFDHDQGSINYSSSEELLGEHMDLSASNEQPFQKVKTTWTAVLIEIVLIVLLVESYLLPSLCDNNSCGTISAYSCLIYSHSVTWSIIYAIDRYMCFQHNVSRRNGYLEFYRKTCALRKVPFLIFSSGSALLVIMLTILRDSCNHDGPCNPPITLTRLNYLQILVTLEVAVIMPCIFVYIMRTIRFNRRQAPPDVKEDNTNSFLLSQVQTSEIGFRDENYLDEVLEKQADMIRYLKQHNAILGKKILKLTTQLNSRVTEPL